MNSVVVTGVSTGIGWGITKSLTQHGLHVFGSVRKAADAERRPTNRAAAVAIVLVWFGVATLCGWWIIQKTG